MKFDDTVLKKEETIKQNYGRCSNILNTNCLQNSTDPDQAASEEAA